MNRKMEDAPAFKWLLEESNPAVRYRTLTSLLGVEKGHRDVRRARKHIPEMESVKAYLAMRNSSNRWQVAPSGQNDRLRDPLHEANVSANLIALTVLAEHGLNRRNPEIDKSVNSFLQILKHDEDFKGPCRNSLMLRQLVMLGYTKHEVV